MRTWNSTSEEEDSAAEQPAGGPSSSNVPDGAGVGSASKRNVHDTTIGGQTLDRPTKRFDDVLDRIESSAAFARPRLHNELLAAATDLAAMPEGIDTLWGRAQRFDDAGVFTGGPWEHPGRLVPSLVGGSFRAQGPYSILETLSCLRVLAVATGRVIHPELDRGAAEIFLERATALNLDHLFDNHTEARREIPALQAQLATRLFRHIVATLPKADLVHHVVEEIDAICAQRPIWTHHVRRMIRVVTEIPGAQDHDDERVHRYHQAIHGPAPLSRRLPDLIDYRQALRTASDPELRTEAETLAESLRTTGLASRHHAVLVRAILDKNADLIPIALGLNDAGRAEYETHADVVRGLLRMAIRPSTTQTLYGFARLLERGLLSREDVQAGLHRIADLYIRSDVAKTLLATRDSADGISANAVLLAGTIRVLGQPLGIGQGNNPTCQAARGISLWSQHNPGYLLELITAAARDGSISMGFEGALLASDRLGEGLVAKLDPELDPVSLVLVPHLDRLYDAMMRGAAARADDGHKWVNPAMYGRLVPDGFVAALETFTGRVSGFGDFVRRFYATHHPVYNGGHPLMYPNPVGIVITSAHGDLIGFHAVTIQRVGRWPEGDEREDAEAADTDDVDDDAYRVYFYNPNNEGRQDWGQGIHVSVRGHGEREGESSLPFSRFAARLYAFHFNPNEVGDVKSVPSPQVTRVSRLAAESWGRAYPWDETPGQFSPGVQPSGASA